MQPSVYNLQQKLFQLPDKIDSLLELPHLQKKKEGKNSYKVVSLRGTDT